jgi:hypothetical protein
MLSLEVAWKEEGACRTARLGAACIQFWAISIQMLKRA